MTDHDRERGRALPVEPLSDEAWARIETGLRARLEAERVAAAAEDMGGGLRHTGLRWMGAGALVAAAAALVAVLAGGGPHSGEDGRLAQPRQVVAHGTARTTRAGDAEIELQPDTRLTVTGDESTGYAVRLEQGEARFSVPPRAGRPAFRVAARDVEIQVVGTRFRVAASRQEVQVEVTHGTVRVLRGDDQARPIHAGQRWSTAGGLEAREEEHERKARPTHPPRRQARRPARPSVDATPKPPRRQTAEAPRAHQAQAPAAPAVQTESPQERFERAAALEPRAPERALHAYRELAEGEGPWAENALFAAARLELELGHERRARGMLRRYLRRYPAGANAADARRLLNDEP